jgi:2-keto-3-deoxy-6-phosphogluconate aldolase
LRSTNSGLWSPRGLVGAGTVISAEQVHQVARAGWRLIVMPQHERARTPQPVAINARAVVSAWRVAVKF